MGQSELSNFSSLRFGTALALPEAMSKTTKPSEWSDGELLERVLADSNVAWNEFLSRYKNLIFRCITKVTHKFSPVMCNADVDEVFAEVMLALVHNDKRKLRLYNPERGTKLGSWIGMISINAAYDYLRGAGRRPMLDRIDGTPERNEETTRTPLDVVVEKERWQHLNGILADFSDKDRQFLDLYYAKGLDAAVIADEMSISLKTVYSKKHKIRAHLKACLSQIRGENALGDLA